MVASAETTGAAGVAEGVGAGTAKLVEEAAGGGILEGEVGFEATADTIAGVSSTLRFEVDARG